MGHKPAEGRVCVTIDAGRLIARPAAVGGGRGAGRAGGGGRREVIKHWIADRKETGRSMMEFAHAGLTASVLDWESICLWQRIIV